MEGPCSDCLFASHIEQISPEESAIPQHENGVQSRLVASVTRDDRTATFSGTGALFSTLLGWQRVGAAERLWERNIDSRQKQVFMPRRT